MNRFVQIAAILVIALFVGPPIAEELACSSHIGPKVELAEFLPAVALTMKRTLAYLSLAAVLGVATFAQTSSFAKNTNCKDCCKDNCRQTCCKDGCTGSCCKK